jgi:hypothetical protein
MPRSTTIIRIRNTAILLLLAGALAGCESTSNWMKGRKTAKPSSSYSGNGPLTDPYIDEIYRLVNGDPATQAEIAADAQSAAQLTPSPATELRYALILGTPGHAETNESQAQNMLRELLANTALMTQMEIELATIQLKAIEQRIGLEAEVRRLRSANSQVDTTEDAAIARQIANVEAQNRQLKQALAEAEEKLDAITSIERSTREQPDGN